MKISTIGNALVGIGALVGVVVVAAIAADYVPTLSPEMVKLLIYKGFGALSVGLMIAGTWIARSGRNNQLDVSGGSAVPELHSAQDQRILLDASSPPPPMATSRPYTSNDSELED
ncbi:MAG: hypothetical protein ABJC63_08055 [Gemmatimonadales bacterium]